MLLSFSCKRPDGSAGALSVRSGRLHFQPFRSFLFGGDGVQIGVDHLLHLGHEGAQSLIVSVQTIAQRPAGRDSVLVRFPSLG